MIIAYHATNAAEDFDAFALTYDYGYHFGSLESANRRLRHISDDFTPEDFEHLRIIPCVLLISNPLRLPDCHTWESKTVIEALRDAGVLSDCQADELIDDGYFDTDMFREVVEAKGYDSIVYDNQSEQGGDSYMLMNPDLIRFALCEPTFHHSV